MRLGLLICLVVLVTTVIALSKSGKEQKIREEQEELRKEEIDRKKKQKQEKEDAANLIGLAMRNAGSEPLEFRPRALTKEFILDDHAELADTPKKYPDMPTLAYITPWNNAGYDRAVRVADRLTHVAPVWLQLKPDPEEGCTVTGTHDIDQGWIERLREANPKLKIVPRLIVEEFSPEALQELLTSESLSSKCIKVTNELLQRNRFDGVVFEVWSTMLRAAHQHKFDLETAIESIGAWGKDLHKRGMQIILPIMPPVDANLRQVHAMWNDEYWKVLGDNVDFIQIMTHDYYSTDRSIRKFPQAPIRWVEQNLRATIGLHGEHANRVLLGLYHYGFRTDFGRQQQGAVMAKDFLEVLENEDSVLEWDSETQEHLLVLDKMQMYFPTVSSLELRTRLAFEYGAGVSVWDLGQGLEHFSRIL